MITGSTGMGNGLLIVSVDHDPTAIATDAPMGSFIVKESTGQIFGKADDGETTNVQRLVDGSMPLLADWDAGAYAVKLAAIRGRAGVAVAMQSANDSVNRVIVDADGDVSINPPNDWDLKVAGTSLLKGSGTVVTLTGNIVSDANDVRAIGAINNRFANVHMRTWHGERTGGSDLAIVGRTGTTFASFTTTQFSWNPFRYDYNWSIPAVDRANIFFLDAGYANAAGTKEGYISINTHYRRYTVTGIVASVTQTQAGGTKLTGDINRIITVANANDAAVMPYAEKGVEIVIENNGANVLQLFPEVDDNIDGTGVDASVTLAAGASVRYYAYDSVNWSSIT